MSLVPANINVNFTAVYVGNHRVCYRIGDSGEYTCTTVNCAGGGTACAVALPIFVDNETCDSIQFNGYVQPSCIDIASEEERVAFSETFVPEPDCANYIVLCASSGVGTPEITNEGTQYNPLSPPAVLFTGGGGTGVAGTAVVGAGAISDAIIGNHGDCYIDGTYTNVDVTGGSGTGAKATVVVAGLAVTSITITTAGTGYLSSDTLGLDYTDMGLGAPPCVPATFTATSNYGKITSITITNAGTGYTTAPTITIGTTAGVQATATAVLAGCPEISSTGCNGVTVVIPANTLEIGDSVSICNKGGTPVLNSVYVINQSGNCLCSGTVATIGVTGPVGQTVKYFYNRNNGGVITGTLTVGGSPSVIVDCVVPGTVIFQQLSEAVGTVSYGGACS